MPTAVDQNAAVFHLVWTYNIKAVDGRKKARCVCDSSSRSGSVKVLDEVYANCVDQTSARLFYAVAAAENLLVFGSDVCNAFAEAPPPKQGFYIRPDCAFNEWWENYKGNPPFLPDTSSLFCQQCKAIWNHLAYGRNTLTPSSVISG